MVTRIYNIITSIRPSDGKDDEILESRAPGNCEEDEMASMCAWTSNKQFLGTLYKIFALDRVRTAWASQKLHNDFLNE